MEDVNGRLEQRLAAVEGGVAELREQLSATQVEMSARFDQVPTRAEMNARFDEARVETYGRFGEARRHVQVLLEDQRSETRLVSEGVAALGERMERRFAELRELIAGNHRFWEVAFLDHERRIRGVEERG